MSDTRDREYSIREAGDGRAFLIRAASGRRIGEFRRIMGCWWLDVSGVAQTSGGSPAECLRRYESFLND